jgi:nucleoside-diphosphate kinase
LADEGGGEGGEDGGDKTKGKFWEGSDCKMPATGRPTKTFQSAAASTLRSGRLDLSSSLFVPGAPTSRSGVDRIPLGGVPESAMERTFVLLHPAAVKRGLIATILARFELAGIKVVALKMAVPSVDQAKALYEDAAESMPLMFPSMVRRIILGGPIVAIVLEGAGVVQQSLACVGAVDPYGMKRGGTVRGDLCTDPGENLLHTSATVGAAAKEIALFVSESEVASYEREAPDALTQHLM